MESVMQNYLVYHLDRVDSGSEKSGLINPIHCMFLESAVISVIMGAV